MCDDRSPGYRELLGDLFAFTGNAWILGVTGNPGAGKSTLVDRLIGSFRSEGQRVAVIAIDPTSPFSGGAILGDRIRMQRHFDDENVFIRSLATRGATGGLSRSTWDVLCVLDAWGADVIIVETVGVGQDELDVVATAHTTLVVMTPGMGDEIQAIKAGILECADVFAVNKADRPGADATVRDLEMMLALGTEAAAAIAPSHAHASTAVAATSPSVPSPTTTNWVPPIVRCIATKRDGLEPLLVALEAHRQWRKTPAGQENQRYRQSKQLRSFLRDMLFDHLSEPISKHLDALAEQILTRQLDPYAASQRLLAEVRTYFSSPNQPPPTPAGSE